MEGMTIGKIAKQSGVNIETVRYYERIGLIKRPLRTSSGWSSSGYRRYPPETVKRIQFIKHAKELGFSLKEAGELLSLRVEPGATCADIRDRTEAKIADIDARVNGLQRMKDTLVRLIMECKGCGPVSECPILEALDK